MADEIPGGAQGQARHTLSHRFPQPWETPILGEETGSGTSLAAQMGSRVQITSLEHQRPSVLFPPPLMFRVA